MAGQKLSELGPDAAVPHCPALVFLVPSENEGVAVLLRSLEALSDSSDFPIGEVLVEEAVTFMEETHSKDEGVKTFKVTKDFPIVFLENSEVSIGRDPSADLCVPVPTLSKVHAVLADRGGQWSVADRRSSNGTFVGGRVLEPERPSPLVDGARIAFGSEVEVLFFTASGLREFVRSGSWRR